jgi:hypothetical protein
MTPVQKRILLVLSIAIALTRPLAVAHSLNDWDEALFSSAVTEYDVNVHHPHPPGYPLFIAAGKGVHLLGLSEFRSLQIVVLLGGFFLFPALFFLGREIGFGFTTSIVGAAIFVFLPNVWIYGGTGFSDIPATTLGFTACALLLRGRTDPRAYFLGAIVLGIAAGFRLPNLLLGAVPALLATIQRLRQRDFRAVAFGVLLGAAITGGSYLGAALSSGTIEDYRYMLRAQSDYVRDVDSWRSPIRLPLGKAAAIFFLWPVDHRAHVKWLVVPLFGLIAVIARRRWPLLLPLAMIGPLMVVAWLNLDLAAAGRYAIAYLWGYTFYAAHALRILARKRWIAMTLGTLVVLGLAVWTWPALRQQRASDAPAAGALLWIQRNVPTTAVVYLHASFRPHAAYLLPDRKVTLFEEPREISRIRPDGWVVEPRIVRGGMNFVWPRGRLWKIIRRRNFEVAVTPLSHYVQLGDGWYPEEGTGEETYHWMGREAHATLPPSRGSGKLLLKMQVPVDVIQPPPTIEVWVNGVLVERFTSGETVVERSWTVASRGDVPNELRIVTSAVAVPARLVGGDDTRELGLRIDVLTWTPTP